MAKGEEMEFADTMRITKDRIAVLIGKKGKTKKEIEERTKVDLDIDSESGSVTIKTKDGLSLYNAQSVIKAISRGFNPKIAMDLTSTDYQFELIKISDFVSSKNALYRVRGRVIGSDGMARKTIEKLTDSHIVIFGKTVGIIAKYRDAMIAKEAVINLINGSPHSSVFHWLEKQHKKRSEEKMLKMYGADQNEEI